jgi:UDP-N-acetyl-D-mannosaminuronic acid transferase (WecB/TagA/CpsF family)
VALILDEMPRDLVQDHKIIERMVRKQNDEHAEKMKVVVMANIKKVSHCKQNEEIQEYVETHDRR